MVNATKLTYSEIIAINMAAMPVNFTDTGFEGHRVQCKIAREDLNLYLKWHRTVGSEHPVGYIDDISGFCACIETALGDGFLDLDSVPNKLSFTSGVLANSYNITNSANDLIMAYILYKVYGATSFNTNTKLYNRSNALSILANSDVAYAIGGSVDSQNMEGGAVDTLFRDLLIANPMRFFNQTTGTQLPGIFETTANTFSSGDWNTVVGDIIELNVVFVFKAPITRSMITGVNTQASTQYVIIPTDDTLQIRLQIVATATRSARRIAQIASNGTFTTRLRYVNSLSYLQVTDLPNGESVSSIDILISSGPFSVFNTATQTNLGPSEMIPFIYDNTLGGYVFNTEHYTYTFIVADLIGVSAAIIYSSGNTITLTIGSVQSIPFAINFIDTVITGFTGPLPSVLEIPSTFTEIQTRRVMFSSNIQEVILPSTFTTIGASTFALSYITTINFPENLISIGNAAFSGCENLEVSSLPASISSIGEEAFFDCYSVSGDTCPPNLTTIENRVFKATAVSFTTLPVGVTRIGDNAFSGCSALTEMALPEGLLAIGNQAFQGVYGLSNIYIPQTISSIGAGVLQGTGISTLTWNFALSEIPDYMFLGCPLLRFEIPSSVAIIGEYAFQNCFSLPNLTLPPNVTTLKTGAYSGCRSFTTVFVPSTITTLQGSVFLDCHSVVDATIEGPHTSLPSYLFAGCSNLNTLTLPDSIVSFEDGVFSGCASLSTLVLPPNISTFGSHVLTDTAFYTINLPSTLQTLGGYTFVRCSNLSNVQFNSDRISFGDYDFTHCVGLTDFTFPSATERIPTFMFRGCLNITTFTMPNTITNIGEGAFNTCKSLVSIEIPPLVSSLDAYTFEKCSNMHSIVLPPNLQAIGYLTFHHCSSLATLTLPASLSSIGGAAFSMCLGLSSIVFSSLAPPSMDYTSLLYAGTPSSVAVYPSGSSTPIEWETALSNAGWAGISIAV